MLPAAGMAVLAGSGPGLAAGPHDRAPMVLAVDVSNRIKPVDHAASGALYGLADEGWPADRVDRAGAAEDVHPAAAGRDPPAQR